MQEKIRLNKYISESGYCSRREADRYIEEGHVLVNGKRAKVGDMVGLHAKVLLNGNPIQPKEDEDFVFIAFNKPVGIVSTTEIGVKYSIIDYIGYHERIFPIGRLDKDSQGLIFLTNNGDIVNKILRAGNSHEKEYVVTVNKPIHEEFILNMSNGVPILGETTKKCKVEYESLYSFRITLIQGLNRQIRRMCNYFDYEVVKLERVRIMHISLRGLPLGEWRPLNANEMQEIMHAVENSSSNPKVKAPNQETLKPKRNSRVDVPLQGNTLSRSAYSNPKARELRGEAKQEHKKHGSASRNSKSTHGHTFKSNQRNNRKK
jgi:23S rRNA pseudouridine2604 synthase